MADVLQEFLVKLGVEFQERDFKKFEEGISGIAKGVERLGLAGAGAATALSALVSKLAANLETLYFASIRTGSSAANLQALERAARNFGAGTGEALSAVEGLALALRTNPGNEALVESWGAKLKDVNGKARDLSDVFVDLAKHFRQEPIWLAEQQAAMLGISD